MLNGALFRWLAGKAGALAKAAALPAGLVAAVMVLDVLSPLVMPAPMTAIRHYPANADAAEVVPKLAERLRDTHPDHRVDVFQVSDDEAGHPCQGEVWAIEITAHTTVFGFDAIMNGPIDPWARDMGLQPCTIGARQETASSIQSNTLRGVVLGAVGIVFVLLWQQRRYVAPPPLTDWQPIVSPVHAAVTGLAAGIAIYLLVSLAGAITTWLGGGSTTEGIPLPELTSTSDLWQIFGPAVLVMPLVEEYLFRALLLERTRRVIGDRLALVYATWIFSALHFPTNPTVMVGLFVAGLGFGLVWLRTRSLLACTLAHALFNLLATLAGLWLVQSAGT